MTIAQPLSQPAMTAVTGVAQVVSGFAPKADAGARPVPSMFADVLAGQFGPHVTADGAAEAGAGTAGDAFARSAAASVSADAQGARPVSSIPAETVSQAEEGREAGDQTDPSEPGSVAGAAAVAAAGPVSATIWALAGLEGAGSAATEGSGAARDRPITAVPTMAVSMAARQAAGELAGQAKDTSRPDAVGGEGEFPQRISALFANTDQFAGVSAGDAGGEPSGAAADVAADGRTPSVSRLMQPDADTSRRVMEQVTALAGKGTASIGRLAEVWGSAIEPSRAGDMPATVRPAGTSSDSLSGLAVARSDDDGSVTQAVRMGNAVAAPTLSGDPATATRAGSMAGAESAGAPPAVAAGAVPPAAGQNAAAAGLTADGLPAAPGSGTPGPAAPGSAETSRVQGAAAPSVAAPAVATSGGDTAPAMVGPIPAEATPSTTDAILSADETAARVAGAVSGRDETEPVAVAVRRAISAGSNVSVAVTAVQAAGEAAPQAPTAGAVAGEDMSEEARAATGHGQKAGDDAAVGQTTATQVGGQTNGQAAARLAQPQQAPRAVPFAPSGGVPVSDDTAAAAQAREVLYGFGAGAGETVAVEAGSGAEARMSGSNDAAGPVATTAPQSPAARSGVSAPALAFAAAMAEIGSDAPGGEDRSVLSGTAGLEGQHGASLTQAQAQSAQVARGASTPAPHMAALATSHLAAEVARYAGKGQTRFQIRMDPPELGRVDVELKISRDGTVKAHLSVERGETLDMFMRDQRGLERALDAAGLKLEQGSVQLSLKDQGAGGFAQQQGTFGETRQGADQGARDGRSGRGETDGDEDRAAITGLVRARVSGSAGSLDIQI